MSVFIGPQISVREPGRTADPSASLGMTKGRVTLRCTVAKQTLDSEKGGVLVRAYLATPIFWNHINRKRYSPLCHPERSRGICSAPRLPHKGLRSRTTTQYTMPGDFIARRQALLPSSLFRLCSQAVPTASRNCQWWRSRRTHNGLQVLWPVA